MKKGTPLVETEDAGLITRAYNLGLKLVPNLPHVLTVEELEYWEQHLGELKDAAISGFSIGETTLVKPTERFALLVDLGVITVPAGYMHGMCLSTFHKNNRKKFCGYNDNITDKNFPHPSRILKPGDKLRVRAYQQIVSGTTTSEERMAFLEKQKGNVYTGAQGASLVFEQKRNQLPKGKWYISFDEAENLWEDSGGYHRVPRVLAFSDGAFEFDLGYLEPDWYDGHAFLSFSDSK